MLCVAFISFSQPVRYVRDIKSRLKINYDNAVCVRVAGRISVFKCALVCFVSESLFGECMCVCVFIDDLGVVHAFVWSGRQCDARTSPIAIASCRVCVCVFSVAADTESY